MKNPSIMTLDNNLMLLHPPDVDNAISSTLMRNKIWEPLETRILKGIIKPGMTVVDLGANIGYYTLLASQSAGRKGRVFAFEPAPDNFKLLQKNVRLNHYEARAILINEAVGESSGEINLFLSPENKGDHRSFDSRIHDYDRKRCKIPVKITCLDDFFGAQERLPNVIKMDIQGYESKAMKGMQHTLARCVKLDLLTEVWPKGLSEAGSSTAEYVEDLIANGFILFRLDAAGNTVQDVTVADIFQLAANCADDEYLDLLCRKV